MTEQRSSVIHHEPAYSLDRIRELAGKGCITSPDWFVGKMIEPSPEIIEADLREQIAAAESILADPKTLTILRRVVPEARPSSIIASIANFRLAIRSLHEVFGG